MLNAIIRFALRQQMIVMALAVFLMGYGTWQALHATVDVFPDLNRPRVVIMTEAPGLAPEEVETLVTFPIETAINGANGVQAVRSSSGIGISVIYVEFDWGTDIYTDRQIVMERLQLIQDRMPAGVMPTLAPISSVMGQILMLGMWSDGGVTDPVELRTLADWVVRQRLLTVPGVSQVFTMGGDESSFRCLSIRMPCCGMASRCNRSNRRLLTAMKTQQVAIWINRGRMSCWCGRWAGFRQSKICKKWSSPFVMINRSHWLRSPKSWKDHRSNGATAAFLSGETARIRAPILLPRLQVQGIFQADLRWSSPSTSSQGRTHGSSPKTF
jgi:hypothetical protein